MKPGANLTPKKPAQKWPREPMLDRIDSCRVMLVCHGFLSDAENERVKKRIQKWIREREVSDG